MRKVDKRKDYKDKYWQIGRVLRTRTTLRYSREEFEEAEKTEKKSSFVNFSSLDEGRSRILLFFYSSEYACKRAVNRHNSKGINYVKNRI